MPESAMIAAAGLVVPKEETRVPEPLPAVVAATAAAAAAAEDARVAYDVAEE